MARRIMGCVDSADVYRRLFWLHGWRHQDYPSPHLHLIFTKNAILELKRIIHPNAVVPVKINEKSVSKSVILKTMTFVFMYFFLFVIGIIILLSTGIDFNTSVGASIASLSNLGTGIGSVGPWGTYAFLPQAAKWVLMAFMLLGRVEIFTLISLFSRNFWK